MATVIRAFTIPTYYKSLDRLQIHPDDYHRIEDYLVHWLLTHSVEEAPRCYIIVLSGIMKRRVLNAHIRGVELDARHTKNLVSILMVILIHSSQRKGAEPEDPLSHDLKPLFDYYYGIIQAFLKRESEKFTIHVRKSLSLRDKFKSHSGSDSGSGNGMSIEKSDYQYHFVRESIHLISSHLATQSNEFIKKMKENVIVQTIYHQTISTRHCDYFRLSIPEMERQYHDIPLDLFLQSSI
jgi:hypothetical protein